MTATAGGKRPPRAPRRVLPPVTPDDPGETPSVPLLEISGEAAPEEWDVLFTVDGKPYKLLKNPPGSMMLTYLDVARRQGPNIATSWAMEAMISGDGYQVLLSDQRVSEDAYQQLATTVVATLLGADPAEARRAVAEGLTPKASPNGSRRPMPPR